MQMVKCYECSKRYNYDDDGFCPKCGAFNQPLRSARIGADGSVVRGDGINERGHTGSFVHKEYHAEEKARRFSGLEKHLQSRKRAPKPVRLGSSKAGPSSVLTGLADLASDLYDAFN